MTQQFGLDDFLKQIKSKPDEENSSSRENSNKSTFQRSAPTNANSSGGTSFFLFQ